jgi:ribosome recycling factor
MAIDEILFECEERMEKCISDYEAHLKTVRSGQATTESLEHVQVDIPSYGGLMPLKNVALIARGDARMLTVKPFDPKTIKDIEKSINFANLGVTTGNDGKIIRVNYPPMSEETRKKSVKQLKDRLEQHKISLRQARQDAQKRLKEIKGKSGVGEDAEKKAEQDVNDLIKKFEAMLEDRFAKKEQEVMTV